MLWDKFVANPMHGLDVFRSGRNPLQLRPKPGFARS
jgi:hypothetical protein